MTTDDLSEKLNAELNAELNTVHTQIEAIAETEHSALSDFIRHELANRDDPSLALVVLAAGLPALDTPADQARRIHLAAALELLAVALSIHKLLLLPQNPDASTDKSLVGGAVLAGDYCFSQAAALAARTGNPQVVAIFSELLRDLSELHLRRAFGSLDEPFDERAALLEKGARAAVLLADLPAHQATRTAAFCAGLPAWDRDPGPGSQEDWAAQALRDAGLAPHQLGRWRALLELGPER